MKSVLISIRKEHNKNIFDGTKRFEGRKTLPVIIPLKNYIDNTSTYNPSKDDVICYVYEPKAGGGCGKVVGQFICDFAQNFHSTIADMRMVANALCVTEDFAKQYFNREIGYMLRVCIPKRYDKPKGLHHFFKPCGGCDKKGTIRCTEESTYCRAKVITRPPQSWCYVEGRSEI